MKANLILTIIVSLGFNLATFAKSADASAKHFGTPISNKKAIPMDSVLTQPITYLKAPVVAEAQVKKVCLKKGCWMEVGGEEKSARVTFQDYGFFVPKNILDKKVKIEGSLVEKVISIKDQRHFLEDEGRSAEEIAAIKAPQKTYEFVATGVEILD